MGKVLAGRYEIVRRLGSGGMGEVFEARDLSRNGLRVAIKRLFDMTPKGLVCLKREYRRMEGIAHPNLLTLYGLEDDDGQPFIVMEYVDGVLFYDALPGADGGVVDIAALRGMTRQLTLGVLELHEQGRVHRDLKGLNVLVSRQGRVVILDFGLVNEIERRTLFTTSPGKVDGTPLYMAPEQLYGNATVASDWYAVGVMLYRAVTGQYPLQAPYPEIMYLKDEKVAPRARELVPNLPPELDELIARLLEHAMDVRANGIDLLAWCEQREGLPRLRPKAASASSMVVGREPQLASLAAARARFMTRVPLRIDITGASGTGKTALMRRFLGPLREDPQWVVLEGRCYEHDSVPYKAFDGVIDSLGRYLRWLPREQAEPLLGDGFRVLCRLFPTLRRGSDAGGAGGVLRGLGLDPPEYEPQELRRRAFVALRNLLHRIGAGSRLVVAVDDLQWGDVDSARLLSELMAPPGAPSLMFVCTYRSEDAEASPLLRELAMLQATSSRPGEIVVIPVEPLTMGPATALAQQLLGDATAAGRTQAEAIAREVQGNPMLLRALVHFLGDRRDLAMAMNVGTGLSLEQLVTRQLARIDADASRLLHVVAIAGQPTRLDLLEKAAGLTGDPRAVAAQLRTNSLVRTTHVDGVDILESFHQRINRAVLIRLSSAELRECHRRIATTLAASESDPARLAYHWFSCGELDRAAEAALDAGNNALRIGAFERACSLFRLAVTCRPEALDAQRKLAEGLVASGRLTEAAPLLLALAERAARPSRAEQLRREAGEHYMICGELERGLQVLQPLLMAAQLVYPEREAVARQQHSEAFARLARRGIVWVERSELELSSGELARHDLYWSLCKGHMLNDIVRGGLFAAQSAALALELGEPRRICRGLAVAGAVGLERGDEDGRRWLNEADRIAQKIGDRHASALVAICWALVRRGRGEWAQALADLEYGLPRLAVGAVWEHSMASGSLLASLDAVGELSRLAMQSQRLAQAAQDLGSKRMYCLALTFSASAALAADEVTRCRQRVVELNTLLSGDEYQMVHLYALKVAVDLDLYTGDAAGAWGRVLEQWPAVERSRLLSTGMRRFVALSLRARAGLALLASGVSGYDHLPDLIEQDVSQVEKEPAVHALPIGLLLRAGLAAVRGGVDVDSYLDSAAVNFEAAGMVLHAAAARHVREARKGPGVARPELGHAVRLLRMQGVARPERWTTVLAPGLAAPAR